MTSDQLRSSGDSARDDVQMEAWIMAVRSLLEDRLELVFEQAIDLGNGYLQAVDVETNRKPTLQFRVGRRGKGDECRRQAACLADMLVTLGRLERFLQIHPLCPRGQEKPNQFGITVLSGSTVQRTGCET